MPDIAMCYGEGCPEKERCYRYTAKPDTYQNYFNGSPIEEDGTCCYYFINKDEMIKRKRKKNG